MKRKYLFTGTMIFLLSVCVACGKQEPASVEETEAVIEETVEAGETSIEEVTDEVVGDDGMVNPMVEYESIVEMQKAAGFTMVDLSERFGTKNPKYFVIADTVAEIQQETKDGKKMHIRMSLYDDSNQDITGFYGATYQDSDIKGIVVKAGKYENTSIAWWKDDIFSYAFMLEDADEIAFTEALSALVETAKAQKEL